MKVLFSEIKALVPGLKATAEEVAEVLTMAGFMRDSFEKVTYLGQPDYLMSFEIRENRGDLFSVIGLAREAAAYWGLPCREVKSLGNLAGQLVADGNGAKAEIKEAAEVKLPKKPSRGIKVRPEAENFVRRALAVNFRDLANGPSPDWLKEYMELHDMNSIDLLVDLSNYVMVLTGYSSHLLDREKMRGELNWGMNKEFGEMTTLDGTRVELDKKEEIILRDESQILGLAGMMGGQIAAMSQDSQQVTLEMAIYDHALVRKNVRDLKVFTEAGSRLSKDLDWESMQEAFGLLVELILTYAGGSLVDEIFSFYPKKRVVPRIKMGLDKPGAYAGIEIGPEESLKILKNLRFEVLGTKKEKDGTRVVEVKPPTDRVDVTLMEDVVEEVVRINGYGRIPVDETPALAVVDSITPKLIPLAERVRDLLTGRGFDEIMSLPMVGSGANAKFNYQDWEEIVTQNAVNEEYPALRQSMFPGLGAQAREYRKKNIGEIKIFEIGKIFGRVGNKYAEHEALGMAWDRVNWGLKAEIEQLLRTLGLGGIEWEEAKKKPAAANPYAVWDLRTEGETIGILFLTLKGARAEINLEKLTTLVERLAKDKGQARAAVELTRKLVQLDANVELSQGRKAINEKLATLAEKIGPRKLWDLTVADVYPLKNKGKIRYTVRATYQEMSDQEAKELHRRVFGLN